MHGQTVEVFGNVTLAIVHQDEVFHGCEGLQQRLQQSEQRPVDEDHFIFGMVHDVGDLLWKQPDVQGMQHASAAGGSEVQLEMPRSVPRKGGHATAGRNAERIDDTAETSGALGPPCVRETFESGRCRGGNGLVAVILLRAIEQMNDRQRRLLHEPLHGKSPLSQTVD